MLESGWVKLHRKITQWEWYDDIPTKVLFIHLLLTVSIKEDDWHGIHIPRGARVTSRSTLVKETKLTEQQVRTALNHLKSTNEITIQSTRQYTLISVVNYDLYQSNQPTNQPTANQPLTNDQPTTNQPLTNDQPQYKKAKNIKKAKNVKEIYPAPAEIFGDNNLPEDFVPDEGDYFANWG